MSAIKKFFQKRKLDVKFKRAGEGHRLDEQCPSSSAASRSPAHQASAYQRQRSQGEEAQRAAEAALARSQGGPHTGPDPAALARARMKKELEQERKKEQEALALASKYAPQQEVVKDTGPATTVLFKCPDIGPAVLPKDEMTAYIKEFLLNQLAEEPEMTSALMIQTFNTDKDRVKVCMETLCKYLDNIIANPNEEKFRKIRMSNKAFRERVSSLEGTEEFMQAAGFEVRQMPFEDHEEAFYVMTEEHANDMERLKSIKEVLLAAEPLKPQLDRSLKVFSPSSSASKFDIPNEFYSISPEELKKEQQRKQEAVEQLGMLRTKAMREREERRELLKYRYCLVRTRFPDGVLLQGTFKASEKLSAVNEFVRECLVNDWMPFVLCTQTGTKLTEEDRTLAELSLTPAAVVNFEWDKTVMAEVTAQQGSSQNTCPLKPELLAEIQQMR